MTKNIEMTTLGNKKVFFKEKLKYPFYVLKHPMDGFYEIRHRNRGSVVIALLIMVLFSVSYTINRQFASFVVNDVYPRSINIIAELEGIAMFFILFCIANWSVTCLLEGEGRLKDIITVTGYSMLPMVLVYVPATILSHAIAANEQVLYTVIMNASVLYFAVMLLMGIMTVHNFSLGKTLFIFLLTFAAMLLIVFLCLLLSSLINQVINFIKSIYIELLFRT